MRILIIATPRSGSTLLKSTIAKMLKLTSYQEPFNFDRPSVNSHTYLDGVPENVVVKTMFAQIPKNENDSTEFYLKEIQKFDKIILLSRLDIKASYESLNYCFKNNLKGDWHTKYFYDEKNIDISLYSKFLTWVKELIEFSNRINVKISWYEEIFDLQDPVTVEDWDLGINVNEFFTYINSKTKYRVKTKKDMLL